MKHQQSFAGETLRRLRQVYLLASVHGLIAEQGRAFGKPSVLLGQRARNASNERPHVPSRGENVSWFLGLYATSLLSMGALVSGVRWMLAFL